MKWFEDCACLTATGKCSRNVHTEKGEIVGWQGCSLWDGSRRGCAYYYTIKTNNNENICKTNL